MAQENAHTSTLLQKLKRAQDFETFVEKNEGAMLNTTFSAYLSELCAERNLVPERIIKAAQIDRTYGHQLFNGTRKPSRDKVIQLAFGFGMTVEEAQQLLRAAEKPPLYPKIKRDAAILFCLAKKMNVLEAQNLLASLDLTLLGGDWQHGE
ncbi:helix-turn-helix domain-containing protein [Papillibacter cinnamivorans]|uniref:Uncharacterized protein n=1 Tax=Papillibacter cinnamivorans DSM 12816 TaxID=1122930 RepID=A0A1W2BBQ5_9FIRM|nr:helix-turn-helix transcriptional regulator [Papillibacter cinnamivorans]SMC70274.1 hypothetical protein SAMN02745168_2131 [Papillibacter cinnamivorans DSM 12816]